MNDSKVRDIIFNVVLAAAIQGISTAIPFLRLPVVSTVFSFVVTKIAGVLYEEMALYVTFSLIDARVGREKDEYKEALVNLKIVLATPTATPEVLNETVDAFKSKLRALISLRP